LMKLVQQEIDKGEGAVRGDTDLIRINSLNIL